MREKHFIICKICRTKKYINPAAHQIYCSRICREKDPAYKAKLPQRQPRNRVLLTCLGCGVKYDLPFSQAFNKNGKQRSFYHNDTCKNNALKGKPQPLSTIEKRVKSLRGQKRTGKALQNIHDTALKKFGINPSENHNPLPHKNYRGKDWSEKRLEALKRDNYTCQLCGETNKKKLLVDHIVDYRFCFNSELYNLITLCRSCDRKQLGAHYILNKYKLQALLHRRYGYEYTTQYQGPISPVYSQRFVFWSPLTINIPIFKIN